MRITRESLHAIAHESAEKYARRDRSLACIYLTGSLLSDSPLLGGTTDIDLIFVHTSTPPFEREIIPLSDEVHLDIAHYSQSLYRQPRHLREDPWIGSHLVENSRALYETQHWFEFTQAGAGALFDLPENVISRARKLEAEARQSWSALHSGSGTHPATVLLDYLIALENAANSIASISGVPLAERRFILQFPERARAVNRPGLSAGLLDLFAPENITDDDLAAWFEPWKDSLRLASQVENVPPRLAAARFAYYERAAAALNEDSPPAALWLLLRTWTRCILLLPETHEMRRSWDQACQAVGLGGDGFEQHLEMLDAYLDAVEETLDRWAEDHGV